MIINYTGISTPTNSSRVLSCQKSTVNTTSFSTSRTSSLISLILADLNDKPRQATTIVIPN